MSPLFSLPGAAQDFMNNLQPPRSGPGPVAGQKCPACPLKCPAAMPIRAPSSNGRGASSDEAGIVALCLTLGRPCGRNPGCRNSPVDRWWRIHPQIQAPGPKTGARHGWHQPFGRFHEAQFHGCLRPCGQPALQSDVAWVNW